MKKFIFLITLLFTIFSCGLKPEQTVEKFLESVKSQNIEQAIDLSSNPDFVKNLNSHFNNKIQKTFFDALYKNLEYNILNSSVQEDKTIIVNVEISNVDVSELLLQVFQNSLQKAFIGQTNVDIEKEILDLLSAGDFKKTKVVDQYIVEKVGKKYKVRVSSNNIDNLFGGYYSSISNISNIGR